MTTKQDLNGHYCLATHYEQLIKYGLRKDDLFPKHFEHNDIFVIRNNEATLEDYENRGDFKPMHYHNNQWVFGSLEHEEACKHTDTRPHNAFGAVVCNKCGYVHQSKPKPPKRIAREEFIKDLTFNCKVDDCEETYVNIMPDINCIFDYIEYLEERLKHGRARYEANLMSMKDCSEMTTKQALRIKDLEANQKDK